MTNEQLNKAKALIAAGASKRKAAKQLGVKESTLRVALSRASESEAQTTLDPQAENLTPEIDWAQMVKAHDEFERRRIEKEAQAGNPYAILYLQSHATDER